MSRLTPRQFEVAWLLQQGLSNKEIARQLGISEGTVKIHLHEVYDRLGLRTRHKVAALMRDALDGRWLGR